MRIANFGAMAHPLIAPDFAATGLQIVNPAPVTRFQVLGERSSGTNFVKRLLGRNTPLKPTEALGWKHGPPAPLAIPADLAVICVVRDARAWALSMHAKPWHTTPALQALPFADFIRAPWDTIIDRPRYFEGLPGGDAVGRPLLPDRDPATGAMHSNLFALRRAKLASLLNHLDSGGTCILLRVETAQADPEGTRDAIAARLGLPDRAAPFRPVVKRLGSKFKPAIPDRPVTPTKLGAADLGFLRDNVTAATEAALGYDYA